MFRFENNKLSKVQWFNDRFSGSGSIKAYSKVVGSVVPVRKRPKFLRFSGSGSKTTYSKVVVGSVVPVRKRQTSKVQCPVRKRRALRLWFST